MGLFSKAKQAYKQSQEKRAVTLVNAEYMGGYAEKKKALGNLSFFDEQVEFKVALNSRASFAIPIADIQDMAVEGKDEVSRRVTVTRLIAVGIFAFALKKKGEDKDAYITLVLLDGQEAIFHIKNKSPMEVKVIVSKVAFILKKTGQA